MDRTKAAARHANQISTVPPFGMQEPHRSWSLERLLPEQFFVPAWESAVVWTGARRLLCAVLQEAVHTFLTYRDARSAREQRLFREAQAWFWSEERDELYAFENICLHLYLDPDYIRRGLQRWQRPIEPRPRPAQPVQSGKARTSPSLCSHARRVSCPDLRRTRLVAKEEGSTGGSPDCGRWPGSGHSLKTIHVGRTSPHRKVRIWRKKGESLRR